MQAKIPVIVVDDNEVDRYLAKHVLSRCDIVGSAIEVSDGSELMAIVSDPERAESVFPPHPPPALIFLDINMPGMDGFEVLENIQNLMQEEKIESTMINMVVMLTSSDYVGDRERALSFDIVRDYVEKPLSAEKLGALIDRYYTAES